MRAGDLLSARRSELERILSASEREARPHSVGFARRILNSRTARRWEDAPDLGLAAVLERTSYGGYPEAALAGFVIGGGERSEVLDEAVASCQGVLERLRRRTGGALKEFASDDVAVLGVADGLRSLRSWKALSDTTLDGWLLRLIEEHRTNGAWSERARDLAADLLDGRGRLRTETRQNSPDGLALDLCLRDAWPDAYREVARVDQQARENLLENLLREAPPEQGDLERAAAWLGSIDLLVKQAAQSLAASTEDVVRLLNNTQSALKRWVWEENAQRFGAAPTRWMIDKEQHVQSLLWAILYPVFGADLTDEQYLHGYGLAQPRYDLAISSLKLIIEVKFVRRKGEFKEVEEQVAGDLGLYFEDPGRFDRLVAYVYDDCDTPHPEQHGLLRSALKSRDPRVADVVVVSRPGMLPPRSKRAT